MRTPIKILFIVSICVLITKLLYITTEDKYLRIRKMLLKEDITKECSNYKYLEFYNNKLYHYVQSLYVETYATKLISYVNTKEFEYFVDYSATRFYPFIVVMIIGAFISLSWVGYCICCICPYFYCIPKKKNCGKEALSTVIMVIYISIIAGSILGMIYSIKFTEIISQATCQVLNMYQNILDGQDDSITPRWSGIDVISQKLDYTINTLDAIKDKLGIIKESNWVNGFTNEASLFENNLNEYYKNYKDSKISTANPLQKEQKIIPLYIRNLGNYSSNYTYLNNIFTEFDSRIKYSTNLVNSVKDSSKILGHSIEEIKNVMKNIKNKILEVSNSITPYSSSLINKILSTQRNINNHGRELLFFFWGIIIFVTLVSFIVISLIICCCNKKSTRVFMHIMWNINLIMTVIVFIVGIIFGIGGLFAEDLAITISSVLSEENILKYDKLFESLQFREILNTCVNYDGDLANRNFNVSNSNTKYLFEFYDSSSKLVNIRNSLISNKSLITIYETNKELMKIINDIRLSTDKDFGDSDVTNVLFELNRYTDSGTLNTFQIDCTKFSKDFLTVSKDYCPSNYPYTNANVKSLGERSCIILSEINYLDISARYTSLPEGCKIPQNFISVKDAIMVYFKRIKDYEFENKNLITLLIEENNKIDNKFVQLSDLLIKYLNSIDEIISPLFNIYKNSVGDSNMFSAINCEFIKTDISLLQKILIIDLSPISVHLSIIMLSVSFLCWISVFFIILLLNRHPPTEEVKEVKEEKVIVK